MKITRLGWRVILVLVVVCIVAILSLNRYANWRLQLEIARLSEKKLNGLYSLSIGKAHLSIWNGSLSVTDISVTTDTTAWTALRTTWPDSFPPLVEMSVQSAKIRGFKWGGYFSNRSIGLRSVVVQQPVLQISHQRDTIRHDSIAERQWEAWQQRLTLVAKSLSIGRLNVYNANIAINTLQKGDTLQQRITGVDLKVTNIKIDDKSTKISFYKGLDLNVNGYAMLSNIAVHGITFKQLKLSRTERTISLQQFSAIPRETEQAFFQRQPTRKAYLAFSSPKVSLIGFDVDKLLTDSYLWADSLILERPTLDAAISHYLPLPYRKILPHEIAQQAGRLFRIGKVVVQDCAIAVTTRVPGADYLMTFDHSYVSADNLTNDSLLMNSSHPLQIWAEAQFMNRSLLKTQMNIPLLSSTFDADYTATIQNFPLEILNPILSHKNVRIKSGFIKLAEISSTIQNGVATGAIKMQYDNLEVQLLDKDTRKPRKIMSGLMAMVVKEDNLRDNNPSTPFITGAIDHVRDRQEDFFVFLWHSLQTGFLPAIVPSYHQLKKVIPKK